MTTTIDVDTRNGSYGRPARRHPRWALVMLAAIMVAGITGVAEASAEPCCPDTHRNASADGANLMCVICD
jgi:hypothetical protein